MARLSLILIFFLSCSCAFGQFKNFNTEESIWNPGTIKLENGEEIRAELNYNFITGVLKARNSDKETGVVYTANKVVYFELLAENKKLLFYSLPFDFEGMGHYTPAFFEIIYQNGDNALLSRHDFEYKERQHQSSNDYMVNAVALTVHKEKVYRTIYLAANGEIYPLLRGKVDKSVSVNYEKDFGNSKLEYNESRFEDSKTKREEVIYKSILKKDIGEIYPEVYYEMKDFIKDNKIDMDKVEGWKSIIDYKNRLNK